MKKSGNGKPETCAYNILRTVRGEVPFERTMGVSGSLIDQPANLVINEAETDALRQLEIFEPRIDADRVAVTSDGLGGFVYDIQLSRREG